MFAVWAGSDTLHLVSCAHNTHAAPSSSLIFANGQFMQIIQFQWRYECVRAPVLPAVVCNNFYVFGWQKDAHEPKHI